MNFPGVIAGDEDMLRKIAAAKTVGKPIDGHVPGLLEKDLDIYIGAVSEGKFHRLPLPVAGLMSAENAFDIATQYESIDRFVKNSLGSKLESPFMTLSFMALLVIPELKLSDKGLFDVRKFHFIGECDTEGEPDRESLPEESQSSKSK